MHIICISSMDGAFSNPSPSTLDGFLYTMSMLVGIETCPTSFDLKELALTSTPGITLLGLGPGDPHALTREAWAILEEASEVWLRTRRHPVVDALPAHIVLHSFDHVYEKSDSFEAVYASIVGTILQLGRRPQGVVYGVPGNPFVAEVTCPEIARIACQEGIPLRVVVGLSFLEPVFSALEIDPFPNTSLVDAIELSRRLVPPFPPSSPAIVAQLHSRSLASEVKLTLNAAYPDEHLVHLVHAAGTRQQVVENLPLYEIDRSPHIGLLSTLYVPALAPESAFEEFQEVIARLRSPDGCPWDRQQTHLSLRRYLLEEAYEALSALDAGDPQAMKEEFGDLLLQIVLHAQIASEEGGFDMRGILENVNRKIVRRHPHVFAEVKAEDEGAVLQNWERLKEQERNEKGNPDSSILDGVALALPALVQAEQYLSRVARLGFDWSRIEDVYNKIEEETNEVFTAGEGEMADEIGDLLFAIANLARWKKIDPESALRRANQRFKERFVYLESWARERGKSVSDLSLEEMLAVWREAKLALSQDEKRA
jgi:tetrapyrrole methylase family protein / MazG family protein